MLSCMSPVTYLDLLSKRFKLLAVGRQLGSWEDVFSFLVYLDRKKHNNFRECSGKDLIHVHK